MLELQSSMANLSVLAEAVAVIGSQDDHALLVETELTKFLQELGDVGVGARDAAVVVVGDGAPVSLREVRVQQLQLGALSLERDVGRMIRAEPAVVRLAADVGAVEVVGVQEEKEALLAILLEPSIGPWQDAGQTATLLVELVETPGEAHAPRHPAAIHESRSTETRLAKVRDERLGAEALERVDEKLARVLEGGESVRVGVRGLADQSQRILPRQNGFV